MSTLAAPSLPFHGYTAFRPFSVSEYHRMIASGILTDEDKVELLEGHVVLKMPRNPPHDTSILKIHKRLLRLTPAGWEIRVQSAITLSDSEPEPDLAAARGDENTYSARHPTARDVGMVLEVSDSTLDRDRNDKLRIYARAGIPIYWIVNLVDRCVEVYTTPSGPTATPAYANRQVYGIADSVPFTLDGISLGSIPVAEMLP